MNSQITCILKTRYGIACDSLESCTGGWSARAFKITAKNKCYFLKAYEKSGDSILYASSPADFYMPVLARLNETPLRGSILSPVPAVDRGYKAEDDKYIYLLFDYIDGESLGGRILTQPQVRELAGIIARLHIYGEGLSPAAESLREDFDLTFHNALRDYYISGGWQSLEYLRDILADSRELILGRLDEVNALADKLKTRKHRMTLCHRDAHNGNLMLDKSGRLALIDWEDLKLAPAEADFYRFYGQPCWNDFISRYKNLRPDYTTDKDTLNFYMLGGMLAAIRYFIGRFLYDKMPEGEHKLAMEYFTGDLEKLRGYINIV